MTDLNDIRRIQTEFNGVHESVFRSHVILQDIKLRLVRGDSKETILELISFYEGKEEEKR